MDANDVSKRTVLVLLVITVLVSVVGTWTVLNSMDTSNGITLVKEPTPGQVKLSVSTPSAPVIEPAPTPVTGNIALSVLPN